MMAWIVIGAISVRDSRRLSGPDGPRRLREMDAWQAARLRTAYRGRRPGLSLVLLALVAAGAAVVPSVVGAWWDGLPGWGAAAVLLVAGRSYRAAAPQVLEVLDQRSLPEDLRETSRRRTRRLRQFGAVAVGAFVAATLALTVGEARDGGPWTALGGVLAGVGIVAGLGFLWAGAWRYGDEQPAR
jgi:hypothetical protein